MSFQVCTESFVHADGTRYFAGISHAHISCECVQKNPRRWGRTARTVDTAGHLAFERTRSISDQPLMAGLRSGTATVARLRATPTPKLKPDGQLPITSAKPKRAREVPQLRVNAKPTLTVRLSCFAREAISEEIRWSRQILEDHQAETGGWLFGERDRGCWLLSATQLGDGLRKNRAVNLDWNVAREFARGSNKNFAGAWHCHTTAGGTVPSDTDLANALARLEDDLNPADGLNPAGFAIDLIVTPDRERGWGKPGFTAWKTYRNERGRATTEPVTLDLSPLSRR